MMERREIEPRTPHDCSHGIHVNGSPVELHDGLSIECESCRKRWQLVAAAWREIPDNGSHSPATVARETAVRKPRRWFR